jgi:hypothetical protein
VINNFLRLVLKTKIQIFGRGKKKLTRFKMTKENSQSDSAEKSINNEKVAFESVETFHFDEILFEILSDPSKINVNVDSVNITDVESSEIGIENKLMSQSSNIISASEKVVKKDILLVLF